MRVAVDRFLAESRSLSVPGYEDAVVEALGLTVRLSHPRLLLRVDEELGWRSPHARLLFWHGVGRGIYFDRAGLAPVARGSWRGLDEALDRPRGEEARRNAVAGLAWATTLVNLREPAIVAARLRHARLEEAGDAAANGVASAALLWLDAVGDGPLLRAFRGHRAGPDATARELWRHRVTAPVELGIERVYPLLVEQGRIAELFRYRPVDGWADSVRGLSTGSRTLASTAGAANPVRA